MKGRTSAMLGHLLFGFLVGSFGILAPIFGREISAGSSVLPDVITFPVIGLVGVLIFLGGIGIILKKKILYYVGLIGDVLAVVLALTGFWTPMILFGALLAISMYPELKNGSE